MLRLHWHCDIFILDNIGLRQVCGRTKVVKGIYISFNLWVSVNVEMTSFITSMCFCSGMLWKHIVRCWSALMKGQDMPNLPPGDEKLTKKISFFEVISESLPQLTFSNIIIRIYGVSDDLTTKFFQLFSLASSMLSLMVAFISVSNF